MATKNPNGSPSAQGNGFWLLLACLVLVFGILFHKSVLPGYVLFNNDNPIGNWAQEGLKLPQAFTGVWVGLNWPGAEGGSVPPSGTALSLWLGGAYWHAKLWQALSLMLLGLSGWIFLRSLRFAPVVCVLGGLAFALHNDPFSMSCWGQVSRPLSLSATLLALTALQGGSGARFWLKALLAGAAVGWGIMEGFDVAALYSLIIGAYTVYQAWVTREGSVVKRLSTGLIRLGLVAGFAALVAASSISGLLGIAVQGIAGMEESAQAKQERWDWATQWSLPKKEILSLAVPGLFGYRMDTPDGGQYWGEIGQTPGWDVHHQGFPRYSGAGYYAGVPVLLLAFWAALQALRGNGSVFSLPQRKMLWFWLGLAILSLLLVLGRYAPFYQLIYPLPYFSTIRSPIKFLHWFTLAEVILFAYGLEALWRRNASVVPTGGSAKTRLKEWWARAGAFDRRWFYGCAAVLGFSLMAWLVYASSRPALEKHLQAVQFDPQSAQAIAAFSVKQPGWFVLVFVLAAGWLAFFLAGVFAGKRVKWAGVLLGLLVVTDFSRANLPWIVYWDYPYKYATNPVLDFLREKPYEQRVAGLPFRAPPQLSLLDQLYRIEWMQHHFQNFDIQSLDVIQMPREPEDYKAFEGALRFTGTPEGLPLLTRRWQLTNTRYMLGPAGFLEVLNTQVDPGAQRFRYALRFDLEPKPGVVNASQLPDITAVANTNGAYAVFEFTGALPRVKLYSRWEVSTNDQATLAQLASPAFNPQETVLVASPAPEPNGTNQAPGTVEISGYEPRQVVLKADVKAPSILLFNDHFTPNWMVTVDGQSAPLLRCNYIMRGVYLTPGEHTVTFAFRPPLRMVYVTWAAMGLTAILLLVLVVTARRDRRAERESGADS